MSTQDQPIKNTFERGMWMDSLHSYQAPGTYNFALNMIHESDQYSSSETEGTFIVQEQSTKEVCKLPARPVGSGFVESRDWEVFFLSSGEIGYVDFTTYEYHTIYSGQCFSFDSCEWIKPEFKFAYGCNELEMYFSSNCMLYKMNIDEMLRGTPYCESCDDGGQDKECCEHFDLLKTTFVPRVTVERYEGGGAGAPSGSYSFAVQSEDGDGNQTNWFTPSKPVPLVGPNGVPGEPSKNRLKVHINNLDPKFNRVNVAVIRNIGGVRSWQMLGTYSYNSQGVTVDFGGELKDTEELDPRELFVPKRKWFKARRLKIFDSRLHIYGIKHEKELNTFRYSSQVRTQVVAYAVNQEESKNYKGLKRNETYRFGLVYNYIDNTHSAVGHIAAGGAAVGPNGVSEWNQNSRYSQFQDGTLDEVFKNLNTTPTGSGNTSRAASSPGPSDIFPGGNNTEGSAPSPGNGGGSYSASFGQNKKPLVNKDINNSFLGKDAYGNGEDIEEESLQKRLEAFRTHAPEEYKQACECDDCATNSCRDALDLWEKHDQNYYDYEVNTAWNTRNEINPDPTKHPDIQSNSQVTGNAKAAQGNIFTNARNAEDKEYSARTLSVSGKTSYAGLSSKGGNDQSRDRAAMRKVGAPVEIARFDTKIKESVLLYPATKDCNGQNVYGALACQPIRDHQMPSASEIPIVVSAADGTISRYSMEAEEKGDTHIILLGLAFSDIPIPPDDELPKPLNPTNPYSIVYVERDSSNKTALASGLATGLFSGNVQGKEYLFPRIAINSGEFIDRCVSDGENQSRIGSGASDAGFIFHSPTTDILRPILDVNRVVVDNIVTGSGNRLGLYAETTAHGKWDEPIIDNRGYRGSVNMNHYSPAGATSHDISGITFVRADSVVDPIGGLSTPLCNRYRERGVFVVANIGTPLDASFQGDTVDHYCPITNCRAQYVTLMRDIPDQYGSVENCTYIPLGLEATSLEDREVSGTCGDVFISMYTKRRTNYVSDKNGNDLTVDKDLFNSERLNMGMADFWKLPEDGNADGEDVRDPKSVAGTQGPKRCSPGEITSAQYDVYLPSVAKHNIMFWVEDEIHCDWREVGDERSGEVWYGNLKSLEYDSDTPKQQDWNNCWMNRFYVEHVRPSQKQIYTRIMIRFMAMSFLVAFAAFGNSDLDSGLGAITLIAKSGMVTAFMPLIQRMLFNNRMLNRVLGIREWYVDDSEGNLEHEYVKQFEDIYCGYNLDYSLNNAGKAFFGLGQFFYDCECDDCELGETTNEIYISNKQMQGSPIDSFSVFQANSYLNISASHGKLQDLFEVNNRLYAHTTDTILSLMPDPRSVSNPGLGNQYYREPISLSQGVKEGMYGTYDPNFSVTTKWGHVFLDREHRSLNVFSGDVTEISARGARNFFKKFTDYCQGGCVDQKNGVYWTMGVDHRHNRLLFTKNVNDDPEQSFTLSYDVSRGVWRSFHTYVPQFYIWNRRNMYSIHNNTVYVHDENRGDYLNFYGKQSPAVIEFNAVLPSTFEYDSTILDTEANIAHGDNAWVYNQKVTFNKALVYNRNQCTGWMNLVYYDGSNRNELLEADPANIKIAWQDKEWRFNQVNDFVVDSTQPIFIDADKCSPFLVLNEGNIDQGKFRTDGDWTFQRLSDKNITYRLVFDNEYSRTHLLYFKQAITVGNIPIQ